MATREKLIAKFRRNGTLVNTTNRSEKHLLAETMNLFREEDDIGAFPGFDWGHRRRLRRTQKIASGDHWVQGVSL